MAEFFRKHTSTETLAKNFGIEELICYSDSLICIDLIKDPTHKFYVYAVLIQDVKDLIEQILLLVTLSEREINVQISWPSLKPPQITIWFTMPPLQMISDIPRRWIHLRLSFLESSL
jgi:hypothetical protein